MASLIKGLLGGGGAPEDEPSGADIIGKLKNRLVVYYQDIYFVISVQLVLLLLSLCDSPLVRPIQFSGYI